MNKLLILIISIFSETFIFCEQLIVILSSAKSFGEVSIGQVLKNHSDWHIIDESLFFDDLRLGCLEKTMPKEYAIINNVVDEEDSEKARTGAAAIKAKYKEIGYDDNENSVLAEIAQGLNNNKNVLLVHSFTNIEKIKETFLDTQVLTALAFCSLFYCYSRFKEQNTKYFHHKFTQEKILSHYVELIKLTINPYASFASFSKKDIELLFDELRLSVKSDNEFKNSVDWELSIFQLNELRHALITEDLEGDTLWFEPRSAYDIVLDIENINPTEAAIVLLQEIRELKKNL